MNYVADGFTANWTAEWTGHEGPANVDKIVYRIVPEDATRLVELEAGDTHLVFEAPWREEKNKCRGLALG